MKPVLESLPVDVIQFYLANQVLLHPLVYQAFLEQIVELQRKNLVSAMPLTILEHYYFRTTKRKKAA